MSIKTAAFAKNPDSFFEAHTYKTLLKRPAYLDYIFMH